MYVRADTKIWLSSYAVSNGDLLRLQVKLNFKLTHGNLYSYDCGDPYIYKWKFDTTSPNPSAI